MTSPAWDLWHNPCLFLCPLANHCLICDCECTKNVPHLWHNHKGIVERKPVSRWPDLFLIIVLSVNSVTNAVSATPAESPGYDCKLISPISTLTRSLWLRQSPPFLIQVAPFACCMNWPTVNRPLPESASIRAEYINAIHDSDIWPRLPLTIHTTLQYVYVCAHQHF